MFLKHEFAYLVCVLLLFLFFFFHFITLQLKQEVWLGCFCILLNFHLIVTDMNHDLQLQMLLGAGHSREHLFRWLSVQDESSLFLEVKTVHLSMYISAF